MLRLLDHALKYRGGAFKSCLFSSDDRWRNEAGILAGREVGFEGGFDSLAVLGRPRVLGPSVPPRKPLILHRAPPASPPAPTPLEVALQKERERATALEKERDVLRASHERLRLELELMHEGGSSSRRRSG